MKKTKRISYENSCFIEFIKRFEENARNNIQALIEYFIAFSQQV